MGNLWACDTRKMILVFVERLRAYMVSHGLHYKWMKFFFLSSFDWFLLTLIHFVASVVFVDPIRWWAPHTQNRASKYLSSGANEMTKCDCALSTFGFWVFSLVACGEVSHCIRRGPPFR